MYAAHCSLWTRRGYGTCDDMKQYSTGQRTYDISAAAPSHQPTRYGRETERSDAIPIIRSLSVIPSDASDGLIPRYRQKYQARQRFYISCLNWVFLVSYKILYYYLLLIGHSTQVVKPIIKTFACWILLFVWHWTLLLVRMSFEIQWLIAHACNLNLPMRYELDF